MKVVAVCLIALLLGARPACAASVPAPCAAAVHHQFDFWVGEWVVTENGKPAGSNRIERLLNGCALLENWTGAGGSRGHSLNFYDPARKLWQQTWVDSSPSSLNLSGGWVDGRMVLSGSGKDLKTGRAQLDRIAWTPNSDGTVRQLWDRSQDGGRTWQVLFDGLYRRREGATRP